MDTIINPRQTSAILVILSLVAIVIAIPHAFAQVTYSDSSNPTGPLMVPAWVTVGAVVGLMTGIGVWTAAVNIKIKEQ